MILEFRLNRDQMSKIISGVTVADLGVSRGSEVGAAAVVRPASLNRMHLLDEPLLVAVGRAHRFARRRAVFLREVIGDTFVTASDTDENALLRAHRLDDFRPPSRIVVADWIGKFACVAAGIGIALVPQLVTRALPAGVTVLKLRDEQAPYRRVVAITDARREPSELTRIFIRLAKQAARH
jgi:DNA-binding transcriptional LysR family regulator